MYAPFFIGCPKRGQTPWLLQGLKLSSATWYPIGQGVCPFLDSRSPARFEKRE